ncbi:MAG TPA: hypothetical protein VF610_04230, partial [Segetibacter sp.]
MIAPLTELEMEIVRNDNIILTKNRIIQIVYGLFGELAANYENTLGNHLIWEQKPLAAKISRGENYLGLPYVIMDYPRQFDKTDVFAIRSYFWWGNFFSITLQLSGSFQQKYSDALSEAINKNHFKGWYISLSDDPWQHHFKSDNYVLIEEGRDYKIKR